MMWGPFFGGMGFFGWLWPLMMILFWGAIIGLGVWFARSLWNQSTTNESIGSSAEETLKRRYAIGDITRDEYEESLRVLKS